MQTPLIKASEGRAFVFGNTSLYIGPRDYVANGRNLKRPPVLAVSRLGDEKPTIVAEFPNATSAAHAANMLQLGIDEMNTRPAAPGQPVCGNEHAVHTPFGVFPGVCDLPPEHVTDHAGPLDIPLDIPTDMPVEFPRRGKWVA